MSKNYENTMVCVFNSYKHAKVFCKKVNGEITFTKHGKFKVRYIHSEVLKKLNHE